MVLKPRHPGTQDVLCRHDEESGTAEAGAIVYLSGDNKVAKVAVSGNVPYAILGQRVKAGATGLPQNFQFPGEIGTADARLGDPVQLFVNGGIFDTNHYILPAGVSAGDALYAQPGEGKLTKVAASGCLGHNGQRLVVAIAQHGLTTDQTAAGASLLIKLAI